MRDSVVPLGILETCTSAVLAGEAKDEKGADKALLKGLAHVDMTGEDAVIVDKSAVAVVGCFGGGQGWIELIG